MRVLITGAASPLGQAIAARLRTDYQVRLTDRVEISTDLEFVRSDLGHDEATDALLPPPDGRVLLVPADATRVGLYDGGTNMGAAYTVSYMTPAWNALLLTYYNKF